MKEARRRKQGREGRRNERGRIVDTEIKNCVENEKKKKEKERKATGGREVMAWRLEGEEGSRRNDRNEPGENDLLSLGETPSPRRRPFAVFGPRKPSENSGQFFRFCFFTDTGENDEESHRITARVFIVCFLYTAKTRKCPNVYHKTIFTCM